MKIEGGGNGTYAMSHWHWVGVLVRFPGAWVFVRVGVGAVPVPSSTSRGASSRPTRHDLRASNDAAAAATQPPKTRAKIPSRITQEITEELHNIASTLLDASGGIGIMTPGPSSSHTETDTMSTKPAQRLTATEKRSRDLCEQIRKGYRTHIVIEWSRGQHGSNPQIHDSSGARCCHIRGGGYCKESTALADVLQWLGDDDAARLNIAMTGGAGVPSVERALAGIGWTLQRVGCTSWRTDVYHIARAE